MSSRRKNSASSRNSRSARSARSTKSNVSNVSTGSSRRTSDRHERLRKLLITKFSDLHYKRNGKKLSLSDKKFIIPYIEDMIREGSSSEKELKKVLVELTKEKRKRAELNSRSSPPSKGDNKPSIGSQNAEEVNKPIKPKKSLDDLSIEEDLWSALHRKDQEFYNKDLVRHLKKKKKMKEEQRSFLHEQMRIKEEGEIKRKAEDEKWNKLVMDKQAAYLEEERQKKIIRKQQILDEKKVIEKQLREREMRQKEIEDSRRKEDMGHLKKIRQELIREREEELEKKEENRKKLEITKKYNELERVKREKEKIKLQKEDIELQKLRIQMLEKEERDRQENFKKIYSRQKRHQTNYIQSTFKSLEEKAKEDEERALYEQNLENERIEKEHLKRLKRIENDRISLRNHLSGQINQKKDRLRKEKDELMREKLRLQEEFKKAKELELKKKMRQKERNLKYNNILKNQVLQQNEKKRTKFFMSDHEKKMNSRLLKSLLN